MLHHQPLEKLKPLTGVRIVSLAVNLPGPVAAGRLRDMGAAVIKIEPPEGDPLSRGCPAWYRDLHENVKVVPLDLKRAGDRERLSTVLGDADLLLTSIRPSALDRLGLSWDRLHAQFPRLCHVAIIGQAPPHENRPGHDLTYQAVFGLVAPPALPRALLADLAGAEQAVSAAVALLFARERGQPASAAYVSLVESAHQFALPHEHGLTGPAGLLGGAFPGYNLYEAADGWIAVAALEPHFALRLGRELAVEPLTREGLAAAFRRQTAAQWVEWAASRDLPIVEISSSVKVQGPKR